MTAENPQNSPEKRETLTDDARKFIVQPLEPTFFVDKDVTTFTLIVDWLETGEESEEKLARKTFYDGAVELLRIAKVKQNGNRNTVKTPMTEIEYKAALSSSLEHLEKERTEFTYVDGGVVLDMKYDVFTGTTLTMIEVDAKNVDARAAFDPAHFPGIIEEVSDDIDYTGYRICKTLKRYQ